jgi:DNA helicase II / ATP-dependent DNA helicase PcrA
VIKRLKVSIEPRPTRSRISRRKAKSQALDKHTQQRVSKRNTVDEQEFSQVYEEYQAELTASNLLDYDDLLLRCADLLRAHPECASNVEAVLIDEFQDTNSIQLELMRLFASKNRRITIVGDPDQSIYGFRSAEIQNLIRMRNYYPDTSVINLEENYRSSAAVLRAAQEVIEQDITRPDKRLKATHCYGSFPVLRRLPSPHDEAKWIATEIKRVKAMTGNMTTFSDYAILIRSAHLSLLIENALVKAGIPYRMVGGHRFFDREEIRTLLDYLRTISQPNNNAALSAIINVPSRKIGDESVKELLRLADENGVSLWAVIQKITKGELVMRKKLSRPAEQNLCRLISLIKEAKKKMCNVSAESTAKFLLDYCIKQLDFKQYLRGKHAEDHENRWANVEELRNQAADIAQSGSGKDRTEDDEGLPDIEGLEKQQLDGNNEALASFLANITLSSDLQAAEDGLEKACVTISTIHSAKGLEWPIVFIPAVYEGSIPHSRAEDTDEERRLLYVAMTRAQALLYLTCPLRQSRSDTDATLSSFLPQKLHRYFIQIGPDVTDKVVRDIAQVLRRQMPSQEELIEGLRSLSERESSQDNLWPADGLAKPRQWWDFENEAKTTPKDSRVETVRQENLRVLHNHNNKSQAPVVQVEPTRTSSKTFTAARECVGFSTAASYLELNRSTGVQDEPKYEPLKNSAGRETAGSRLTKRKAKAKAGQGSLATFFAAGSFHANGGNSVPEPAQEPKLPNYLETHSEPANRNISTIFTSHRISSKPAPLKRLQPVEEIPDAKRKQYVFLSSSPIRETTSSALPVESCGSIGARMEDEKENSCAVTTTSMMTMHTTSMDVIQQQQQNLGPRKTYGVRRMMNGWENRKNR